MRHKIELNDDQLQLLFQMFEHYNKHGQMDSFDAQTFAMFCDDVMRQTGFYPLKKKKTEAA